MSPDENRPLHIVNFSGGKDSTYMLLEMIRRGIYFDMVVNVDTGMEFPAMYDHIDQVERFLQSERGMGITRLYPPRSFEELMFQATKETAEPGDIPGYGWPAIKVRWCTGHLKVHLISRYLSGLPVQPYHYIAFAADEQYRLKRRNNQEASKRYPMIEWGVTEAQALAGCYEAGYTWDGLYERFSRVSCWCCPLQSLEELRALQQFYPDLWVKLRDMDDKAIEQFGRGNPYGQFKEHESVRMLEHRFAFERTWAENGGNIRSRAFFQELKKQYQELFFPGGHYFTGPQYIAPVDRLLTFVEEEDLALYDLPMPEPQCPAKKRHRSRHEERDLCR